MGTCREGGRRRLRDTKAELEIERGIYLLSAFMVSSFFPLAVFMTFVCSTILGASVWGSQRHALNGCDHGAEPFKCAAEGAG